MNCTGGIFYRKMGLMVEAGDIELMVYGVGIV